MSNPNKEEVRSRPLGQAFIEEDIRDRVFAGKIPYDPEDPRRKKIEHPDCYYGARVSDQDEVGA